MKIHSNPHSKTHSHQNFFLVYFKATLTTMSKRWDWRPMGLPMKRRFKRRRQPFRRTPYSGFQAELKFHDVNVTDASIAQNGTVVQTSCNLIPQGVTEVTRIGRRCCIKQLHWRFTITFGGTADTATADESIRVLLYLDKQANGAAAAVTDILETDNFQSFNNLANRTRFRTLFDRTFDINANGAAGDGTTNDTAAKDYNFNVHLKMNHVIEFNSTAGAITEITSNNIGVILLAKNGSVAIFDSKMRLRFSDL